MVVAVMAMVATACGDAGGAPPTAIDLGGPSSASNEPSGTALAATTLPASAEGPRQRPDGPDASNFELALGGPGGTFSLSEETRPVFLVFWAEW